VSEDPAGNSWLLVQREQQLSDGCCSPCLILRIACCSSRPCAPPPLSLSLCPPACSLIIVTQSLVKDMFNETPLYKGNALRCVAAGQANRHTGKWTVRCGVTELGCEAAAEWLAATSRLVPTSPRALDALSHRPTCLTLHPSPPPPAACSVLGAIVDPSMLGQLERYFRQMISDKDSYVASAGASGQTSLALAMLALVSVAQTAVPVTLAPLLRPAWRRQS
jgi:hypothetical protein